MMLDPKKLEQLARQIHELLPKSIRDLSDDIEKKIRQMLLNQFSKINFVSREEFDLQTQILFHMRNKLNQLERRLNTLETMPKNDQLTGHSITTAGVKSVDKRCLNEDIIISSTKDDQKK